MVLVGIFFVTGADSASIIMGSISSYGVEEPRKPIVIFWGVMMGAVAAVMLLAGGDDPSEALTGLQQITIVAALPFVVVMVGMCIALTKDLYADPLILRHKLASSVVTRSIRSGVSQHGGETFDIVTLPNAVPGSGPDDGGHTAADATPAGTLRSDPEGLSATDSAGAAAPAESQSGPCRRTYTPSGLVVARVPGCRSSIERTEPERQRRGKG